MRKKLKAIYIGIYDESLNYIPEQEYTLLLKSNTIMRPDGTGKFMYGSIESFFKNWKDIKEQK